MPISAMGPDYTAEHWVRVQKILWKSVEKAKMKPILVWENPSVDVIQNTILQNIYESDLVICDVSGLNPNVMLETGLRLSTKKPTVIVTDRVVKPPFDIQSIGHLHYQKDLEFNAIEEFIFKLSKKLIDISISEDNNTYVPFAEHFEIKTATPKKVTLTSTDLIVDRIKEIDKSILILRNEIKKKFNDFSHKYENPENNTISYILRIIWDDEKVDAEVFAIGLFNEFRDFIPASNIKIINEREIKIIIREDSKYSAYDIENYIKNNFDISKFRFSFENR
ncbi:hypothetical protein APT_01193 [Acetobacter pasteurianus NBRC 101655]|nr:hypothetical protein APT_01193 [Acetobacter pasteurianus NBRC 101655]